ncbi:urease accessory protein UreD [Paenibacillus silviterrae]|uniref:urease accessory protein UreD n=1 Tax=Paenibacillus silviterrae TaxID=3242194 RepID=UPI00254373C9|nr:urease accessory protein UreD [Paenibacillus chinjuensis]
MSRVTGSIAASFASSGGATQLDRHMQSYPLKLAKTFAFGRQLGVYLMDASPGILAGDRYELKWEFGENSQVLLTNQSYTKVHPARTSPGAEARPSEQHQRFALRSGAYVEYMPEPLMLYKDAVFDSETVIELEQGSHLLWSEVLCPGRTHRGEQFDYELYQSRLSVFLQEELIYSARQRIAPALHTPRQLGSWDRHTHLGTFLFFSEQANQELADRFREWLNPADQPASPSLSCGVSHTYKHGMAISILGQRVYEIQALLESIRTRIRSEVFGLEPLPFRK